MRLGINIALVCTILFAFFSCSGGSSKQVVKEEEKVVNVPIFNADSAYKYIEKQVSFGARVPNTQAHIECGDYLEQVLSQHGANVVNQKVQLTAYDGTLLNARNIIASFQPEKKKRIALFAHWDTRPWADHDPDSKNRRTPVIGANDGGSGVGVLIEIARILNSQPTELGIDIILFDAEDYGEHNDHKGDRQEESWCLGSQHWARNPHIDNYNARFGILLDMVGGKGSVFYREGYSELYAKDVNKKVWQAAKRLGYDRVFINDIGSGVTDDHLFVNKIAQIKTIDIIPYNEGGNFTDVWHTVNDNMEHIDKGTLKAVGQTVLEVIYKEK